MKARQQNRRTFLKFVWAAAGTAMLTGCAAERISESSKKQKLNIYSWNDYIHPEAIPEFEKRTGIEVVYDVVSSNEGMIAKFQAGASNYDIVVPSNYTVARLTELKLLRPIELDRLRNLKNLSPRFLEKITGSGTPCYAIPYTFGTTGIAFAKSAFEKESQYPSDWDAFWDRRLAGRITLLEDYRESMGFALKRRGHSYNTRDEKLLRQAFLDLKEQKPLTMCYTSDQVIVYLTSGDSRLSLSFSGDAQQAARENKDVKYIIPASGASMWADNLCIPASSPNPEAAHKWIDFILEPEVAAALSNFTYYATPNQAALKYVKPQLLSDPNLYPPDSVLARCEEIEEVGSALFTYDRLWTELKCL